MGVPGIRSVEDWRTLLLRRLGVGLIAAGLIAVSLSMLLPGGDERGAALVVPLPPAPTIDTSLDQTAAAATPFAPADAEREAMEARLTAEHLAAARAEEAPEPSPHGPAERVALAPGPRRWERLAVPARVIPGVPMLAIVLDDMGLERGRAERAIALAPPLTLAFLPYGREAPALARQARARGHEILLHMPMQPVGGEDAGPGALTVDLAPADIRARVGGALERFEFAIGLNNHMGSRFTADRRLIGVVMDELAQRGLAFVDSRTIGATQGLPAARAGGVAAVARDVFLDNDPSVEGVRRQLDEAERIARRQGAAVAIGHPYEGTIAALATWIEEAPSRGLQLVPVSAVLRWSDARATLAAAR